MLEIDRPETTKRVRKFFKSDLEHYKSLAGAGRYDLKAINYTNTKVKSTPKAGGLENYYIATIEASNIVRAVKPAIENCEPTLKKLLTMKVIQKRPVWQIKQALLYEKTKYYVLESKAFNNFADMFTLEQLKQESPNILDLHVYQSQEQKNDILQSKKLN